MDTARLSETIQRICQPGRGILAADESSGTIKKRFDSINIESTEENRRSYRDMLFSTKGFGQHISGVILFDETVDQKTDDGRIFSQVIDDAGAVPGIKVDEGKEEHPDHAPQTLTHGLDGLGERLAGYTERSGGLLSFTKWRQVILIVPEPSDAFLELSMTAMAQYALEAQKAGYVPIVEPEVLMDGDHSLEQCRDVTTRTLKIMYQKLEELGVSIEHTILKPNMIVSGKDSKTDTPEEVANATITVFKEAVPESVPGIVFLSGGQTPEQATENLNAIGLQKNSLPWWISFSYGRALQEYALKGWSGTNIADGQTALGKRAKLNGLAQLGEYSVGMEEESATDA